VEIPFSKAIPDLSKFIGWWVFGFSNFQVHLRLLKKIEGT